MIAYEVCVKEYPNNHDLQEEMGNVLFHLGRYNDALLAYEKSNSKSGKTYINKANILLQLDKHQDALDAFNEALRLLPQFDKSGRADAYRGKGNILKSQAEVALKKADELDPVPFLPDYPDDLS